MSLIMGLDSANLSLLCTSLAFFFTSLLKANDKFNSFASSSSSANSRKSSPFILAPVGYIINSYVKFVVLAH